MHSLWPSNPFSGALSLSYSCTQTKETTHKGAHRSLFVKQEVGANHVLPGAGQRDYGMLPRKNPTWKRKEKEQGPA